MSSVDPEADDAARPGAGRRLPRSLKTSELIAREIVRDIASRNLQPGDALADETAMTAHYGAGRGSVREALRLLETQGFIYLKPGRRGGPVIARIGPEQLGQMLTLYLRMSGATYGNLAEFMTTISPRLAELAANNPDRTLVEATLRNSNRNPCAKMDSSPNEALPGPHAAINMLAGNPVLTMFADAVDAVFTSHTWQATGGEGFLDTASHEHNRIAEAVIEGDGPKARRLMAEHLEHIFEYAQSRLPGLFGKTIEWR